MTDNRGVYMIMVRDRQVLALRRAEDEDALFRNVLDYPGGRMESGETPEEAAAREGLEETGLRATHVEYLREWSHLWDDGRRFHVTTYVGWEPEGEVALSAEHSEYLWVDPSQMLEQRGSEEQMASAVFASWLDGQAEDTRRVIELVEHGRVVDGDPARSTDGQGR